MNVISIINHKGGVGKTTTTLNLGAALSIKGKRVLMIDLDGQANLTISAGIKESPYSIYDAFRGDIDRMPIVSNNEGLEIVPATLDLQALEAELMGEPGRELILKDLLTPLKPQYDIVLIDCPPALGFLTINALTASQHVLIPVEAEALALKGMTKILQVISKVQKRLNPKLNLLGIVVTKYDSRKVLNRNVLESVQQDYPEYLCKTVIRDNVSLAEAPALQMDVLHYSPKSYGSIDYTSLSQEMIDRLKNNEK